MEESVIELSSESSAPNSPQHVEENGFSVRNASKTDAIMEYIQCVNGEESVKFNFEKSSYLEKTFSKNYINQEIDGESDTSSDLPPVNFLPKKFEGINILKENKIKPKAHELSDSDDSNNIIRINSISQSENVLEKAKKRRGKNPAANEEREQKRAERLEKQAQKAKEKALKQATNEALRCKKPEECLKYIKVCLDQNLLSCNFGGQILVELQTSGMQYNIQSNSVSNSILWTRDTIEHEVGEDLSVNVVRKVVEEDELVIVWKWDKIIELIKSGDFLTQVQIVQSDVPEKTVTLIVYGSKEYFKYQRNLKRKLLVNAPKPKSSKKVTHFENMPKISEDDWELAITELQLFGFQHVMLDSAEELALYIRQFTKAVGEAPYKREKQDRDLGDVDWFGEGDSRDCVRVDKTGNGLLRLWQQQLCQFNNVGLETAQAIAAVYGSPLTLAQAYDKCTTEQEAQLLLAKIPVRRGVGPLTSTRCVGPELSKKIHAFFTCVIINQTGKCDN